MNNYCTLFDSNYLTRGLAMYRSLCDTGEQFILYIFCFDNLAYEILLKLDLYNIKLITLEQLEDERLLSVKSDRTKAEYCWTCTPFIIRYALDKFGLKEVTYLDADIFFYEKPSILLDEFHSTNKSVMITEHRYTPKYDQSKDLGIYCVQFMTFKSNEEGLEVLQWWQDRCLEWCYNRNEEGKFGDQKYLDNWTSMFNGVHVLKNLGGGVAPWNVQQYEVSSGPKVNGQVIVFYHFHAFKWHTKERYYLGHYILSKKVQKNIYIPYIESLENQLKLVRKDHKDFSKGIIPYNNGVLDILRHIKRAMRGTYNVIRR